MDHIGIDVHKRDRQIYVLAASGEDSERRIRTEPERFDAVLGTRPRARIVIEASTDRELSPGMFAAAKTCTRMSIGSPTASVERHSTTKGFHSP